MTNINPKKRPFSLTSKRFGTVGLPLPPPPGSVARLESILDLDGKGRSCGPVKKKSKNVIEKKLTVREKEKNHNQQITIDHPFQTRRQPVNNHPTAAAAATRNMMFSEIVVLD